MVAANFATKDVSVYRLWPKTGDAAESGLTNVDSGDAGGDALFGLSQLLLPQLCAVEPGFLWCENRGHLSGGKQWMVYTEYTVNTKKAFGEYGAVYILLQSANAYIRRQPVPLLLIRALHLSHPRSTNRNATCMCSAM